MASIDMKKYTGSGVLIVDKNSSSVLLVYDYTLNYNCCGGFIKDDLNDPQRIEKTARDELYEETRTLFSCDLDQLVTYPFVDLDFNDEIFRCYIYETECDADICEQFEKFDVKGLPSDNDYLETTAMALFPLAQFRKKESLAKLESTSMARISTGKKHSLNQRVISVIKAAVKKNLL